MYLLIVTGLSGAGKSLALRCLEEQGFFCVDNLPSSMLEGFAEQCLAATPEINRAAVTIDSRESLLSHSPESIVSNIDSLKIKHNILFLDCRDDVLMTRYNEVRRRHPLGESGDAATGVKKERLFLQAIRDRADFILDTSDIASRDFHKVIAKVLPEYEDSGMTLLISSFGYKRGVPVDADIVLDMRFLPNPFYITSLRSLSGMDSPVSEYVLNNPACTDFMNSLETTLNGLLPFFLEQGKSILRVCFGCTGGRHRSVACAEELARRFGDIGINVRVYHRDLITEANDIRMRFGN